MRPAGGDDPHPPTARPAEPRKRRDAVRNPRPPAPKIHRPLLEAFLLGILIAGGIAGPAPVKASLEGGGAAAGDVFTIARLRYRGGGDWYSDPSSLPNLLRVLRERLGINAAVQEAVVEPGDEELFNYPFLYLTGHGKVKFSEAEAARLRHHLTHGGFLWADDNYGMDESFRPALRRIFPDKELVEIPFDHEIYREPYEFPRGLPKIHEHHGGPPHGYGMYHEGRLILFYSYNTDIGDGLEDEEVHHDPAEKRDAALRMAVNIVYYALTH